MPFPPSEARRVYDRVGTRQDRQGFYEDTALEALAAHGAFAEARSVVELGPGTGRLAARLLAGPLPPGAAYAGFDVSPVMVGLARERLAPFASRARVEETPGTPPLPLPDGSADRFVAAFVLDLLPEPLLRAWLAEARRVLEPGGLLAVAGITRGVGPLSRAVMAGWKAVHRLRPAWVGGCRPLHALPLLPTGVWTVRHRSVAVRYGVAVEAVVAAAGG